MNYIVLSMMMMVGCKNPQVPSRLEEAEYTCPMHPQIIRHQPGNCPICGMALVKKETKSEVIKDIPLETLLQPSNQYVVSSIPVTALTLESESTASTALGTIEYDEHQLGTISSRVEGRIEKLYIRNRYQYVKKGDKLMEIYSPELLTSQENYLFVIRHDEQNTSLIRAARQRLLLSGMSEGQVAQIAATGKPLNTVAVYSNYSGLVIDAGEVPGSQPAMAYDKEPQEGSSTTRELLIKEGMSLMKGQPVFSVINAGKALVALHIFSDEMKQLKVGTPVKIIPEVAPSKSFASVISFIEPFYRKESKTITARVYFDNSIMRLSIGSQIEAKLFTSEQNGFWLPESAVLTLGRNNVVFKKENAGFRVHQVSIGMKENGLVQITSGLTIKDSVAVKAQFLVGSESFIQIKE